MKELLNRLYPPLLSVHSNQKEENEVERKEEEGDEINSNNNNKKDKKDDDNKNQIESSPIEKLEILNNIIELLQKESKQQLNSNGNEKQQQSSLSSSSSSIIFGNESLYELFLLKMRRLLQEPIRTLRTAALRTTRYFLKDESFLHVLIKLKLNLFIARSLERDKHHEAERLQALKLIRKWMAIRCDLLPNNIIYTLVSIAEHQEDSLSRICIEVMCEITIRYPKGSSHCGGIKLILNSILDPNHSSIQDPLVLCIIFLLNDENRKYVRNHLDIGILFSPIVDNFHVKDNTPIVTTNANVNAPNNAANNPPNSPNFEKEKRWDSSIKAITVMLRSWTGLIALSSHPFGLSSLINAFHLPSVELHDRILEALFDVFQLTVDRNSNPFKSFQTSSNSLEEYDSFGVVETPSRTKGERHNLLNNYLSALLTTFINCGLIEGLVTLGTKYSKNQDIGGSGEQVKIVAIKATLLLGELLYLTNSLLPPGQCAQVQTLPKLVEFAASFTLLDPRQRSRASTMLTNLHAYHHSKHSDSITEYQIPITVGPTSKWKRIKPRDRRLDRIEALKLKLDAQMDYDQLKLKIGESQVVATKDYSKWKWEIISDLIEGPLLANVSLLVYALKNKFVKRVISYFRPLSFAFSTMTWGNENLKYLRIACQLLQVLVGSDQGADYLLESKLLPEIAELMVLEIEAAKPASQQTANVQNKERLFSADKLLKKMSQEYFTMLGILSSSTRGLEVLKKQKLFLLMVELSELNGRDDLVNLIMTSLDYNVSEDSRIFLMKALSSTSTVVRFRATRHIRGLLRAGVDDFSNWGIDFLLRQLNDADPKVVQMALSILDEACNQVECMDSLIASKTQLLKFGQTGKNLWLKMLSRPAGFQRLSGEFIDEELKLWKEQLNLSYASNIEAELNDTFSPATHSRQRDPEQQSIGVYLSPHFYGELAKTKDGCNVLEKSNIVLEFLDLIKQHNVKNQMNRRASLWALGHIGSSITGFQFLSQYKTIQEIVNLTETDPCLSIRGTCFYVLGMMSQIHEARQILDSLSWESPMGSKSFITLPKDSKSNTFLKMPEYKFEGSFPMSGQLKYLDEMDEISKEILTNVAHLSNTISAESALKSLRRLKALHSEFFSSAVVMLQVYRLLSTYKYKLMVRRFIHELFEGVIWKDSDLEALDVP
eukprot:TRINITY_DN4163_c0_g1_i2.p1 TRINITY_DN4163_c0_g1~~TRINITY_DN4163_c0_g1_i2.p1  ORF type:complete len:1169 (+),score=280.38 TRINITY_DN4163_c0_g1_i2:189-3695(+)